MNPSGLSSSCGRSTPHAANESVKALHSRRNELKQKIQERHMQLRNGLRREVLEAARHSGARTSDGDEEGSFGDISPERHLTSSSTLPIVGPSGGAMHPPGASALAASAPGMVAFGGSEWSEFGNQLRVDVSEPAVMEYLLQLEEEIRQEQLVAMYEQAHAPAEGTDVEEYYRYLMS